LTTSTDKHNLYIFFNRIFFLEWISEWITFYNGLHDPGAGRDVTTRPRH
jgi:hypothetical protein